MEIKTEKNKRHMETHKQEHLGVQYKNRGNVSLHTYMMRKLYNRLGKFSGPKLVLDINMTVLHSIAFQVEIA